MTEDTPLGITRNQNVKHQPRSYSVDDVCRQRHLNGPTVEVLTLRDHHHLM
jgi:hypothetical protein